MVSVFAITFGAFLVPGLKSTSYAQMNQSGGDCQTAINWNSSVKGNRGRLPAFRPSNEQGNVWNCQAKPANAPDQKFWEINFYDVSLGVAYDHAEISM